MSDKSGQPTTARIEAFSDGVVAILITIMILELKVPFAVLEHNSLPELLRSVGPPLLSYVLSFIAIAITLLNHHSLMRIAPHATPGLYWVNALLLFFMSLIPLATKALGDNPSGTLAVAFYGVILGATSVGFTLVHAYVETLAAAHGRMNPRRRRDIWIDVLSCAVYFLGAALAFVSVYLSFAAYVGVPTIYFIPRYGNRSET